MKPRYDSRGVLCFSLILPTRSLRALVYSKLTAQYPELNYCCEWKDANGWGINLTVAEWRKQAGPGVYHVPN